MARNATVIATHDDGSTLRIMAKKPWFFNYQAGQYIITPHDGRERYLSLVSSPYDSTLEFAVRKSDSNFKMYLSQLTKGDRLAMTHIAGDMTISNETTTPTLLLAGGIGVTPFVSIVRQLSRAPGTRAPIALVHSNRYIKEGAYNDELSTLQQEHAWFTYVPIYTREERMQRIDRTLLEAHISSIKPKKVMIAGSHRFIVGMQTILDELGIQTEMIATEVFCGYCPDHDCCCSLIKSQSAYVTA